MAHFMISSVSRAASGPIRDKVTLQGLKCTYLHLFVSKKNL